MHWDVKRLPSEEELLTTRNTLLESLNWAREFYRVFDGASDSPQGADFSGRAAKMRRPRPGGVQLPHHVWVFLMMAVADQWELIRAGHWQDRTAHYVAGAVALEAGGALKGSEYGLEQQWFDERGAYEKCHSAARELGPDVIEPLGGMVIEEHKAAVKLLRQLKPLTAVREWFSVQYYTKHTKNTVTADMLRKAAQRKKLHPRKAKGSTHNEYRFDEVEAEWPHLVRPVEWPHLTASKTDEDGQNTDSA
ncbi:MAG: hypothetical protein SYC29_09075 [Planctomycetota bacterium]|nr:hypothetical protein [Planctomycetota bacterium]